jgi:hypothetical protein
MANENKNVPAKADLTRLKALLGSGLVLSTERIEDFEAMLAGAMEAIGPRDFMEEILVFDVVNATFDIFRYQRHKVLGSERLFKASLAADAERRKKELERKKSIALKEEEARERTENPDLADQKRGKLIELYCAMEENLEEVSEIGKSGPTDLEYSRYMEASLDGHERFDRLLNTAHASRRASLQLLEWYRAALGHQLRQVTDKIIEGTLSDTVTVDETDVPIGPPS